MRNGILLIFALVALGRAAAEATAPRDVPVLAEVDVAVAGGSSAAVAAACAAADAGASVLLVAPRPYVGDDLCGRQALWLDPGEDAVGELAAALFPEGRVTTPFTVKRALERALLRRGVRWLTGSPAASLLLDGQGRAGGAVFVGRSGAQAVLARSVIDATEHAVLARQSAAAFRPFTPGVRTLEFVVVGGPLRDGPGVAGRTLDVTFRNPGKGKSTNACPVQAYAAQTALADGSFATRARAEQALRNLVCGPGMLDGSEAATCWPGDTLVGAARAAGPFTNAAACDLGAFRSPSAPGLYVLSACADVEDQAGLMRPTAFLEVGGRVGAGAAKAAAGVAKGLRELRAAEPRPGAQPGLRAAGPHNTLAPFGAARVLRVAEPVWPALGEYDVVVVGGGTAGAPAGIAAARSGARTLVVEYLDELGGVGTAGVIGAYWYGLRDGFTREIDEALRGANRWPDAGRGDWNLAQKSEWLRRELLKAGADVWLGCLGYGAVMDGRKVAGVAVATPLGCGVVKAKVVVDATGNADIADCAGAATQFGVTEGGMLSAQLAGYPQRNLGESVNNTCFALVDDASALDVWHLMAWGRQRWGDKGPYDAGQMVDSRERRRIVADYMLTTPDILNRRTFADTISHHKSNFDAAAFPTSPMLLVKDMKGPTFEVDLPYRSLLPAGLDGLLVTGLGAGAERDAMTLIRMQPDLQNQGYAAGAAAALAARNGGHTRDIAIKALQKALVGRGVLQARVLTDPDAAAASAESLAKAVDALGALRSEISQKRAVEDPAIYSLAVVMANGAQALPLLRAAYGAAPGAKQKLAYARVLGILGDKTGAPALIAELEKLQAWDEGFGLTSHRESDNTFSEADRVVIALGWSQAPAGAEPLVRMLGLLRPESRVSHYLAVSMALERTGPIEGAAAPLLKLMEAPGFAGHAQKDELSVRRPTLAERDVATDQPDTSLNAAYKELLVARLLARHGDSSAAAVGRGVLCEYAQDVHGVLARYARAAWPAGGTATAKNAAKQ